MHDTNNIVLIMINNKNNLCILFLQICFYLLYKNMMPRKVIFYCFLSKEKLMRNTCFARRLFNYLTTDFYELLRIVRIFAWSASSVLMQCCFYLAFFMFHFLLFLSFAWEQNKKDSRMSFLGSTPMDIGVLKL